MFLLHLDTCLRQPLSIMCGAFGHPGLCLASWVVFGVILHLSCAVLRVCEACVKAYGSELREADCSAWLALQHESTLSTRVRSCCPGLNDKRAQNPGCSGKSQTHYLQDIYQRQADTQGQQLEKQNEPDQLDHHVSDANKLH
jgi:hypothetical protein